MFFTTSHTISILDHEANIPCRKGESLLASMVRLGKKGIPIGCRSGGCGVCKVRVHQGDYTNGNISRAHVSESEERAGFTLACRCHPSTDLTIEVVGKMKKATHSKA